MNERTKQIMIGLAAMAAGAAAMAAANGGVVPAASNDRATIEKIVHDYIVKNPEILIEAQDELQKRQVAKAVNANRAEIETPFAGAWDGAKDADVTLVQFFDYNCGYCRAALPNVARLLSEDKKLRVVYREFPVLGPDSESAARVSLAAAKAGKYPEFHKALYAAGRPEPATVEKVAKSLGISPAFAADPAAQAQIDANIALARPLGLTGTPSWVVGDQVFVGNVDYDVLKAAIATARAK
jgi:protein-disulfide isomerase